MAEGEALLDRILENRPSLEPPRVEPELKHEEVYLAEAEPITPLEKPSPEPEGLAEGFQSLDLPYFEDDFFKEFLRKSVKELIAIMSSEWVEEVELSSEEI